MVVLGIDPGTTRIGFGVIEEKGRTLINQGYGCIRSDDCVSAQQKLELIYREVMLLIERYRPEALAVESLFFNSNVKTAFSVGEARGVILLAAAHSSIEIAEYTPLEVKQAITGNGRADKNQMQQMVKMLLRLTEIPDPDDAADALAVAVCHAHSCRLKELINAR